MMSTISTTEESYGSLKEKHSSLINQIGAMQENERLLMVKIQGIERKYFEMEVTLRWEQSRVKESERDWKLYLWALWDISNPPAFVKALVLPVQSFGVSGLTDNLSAISYSSVEESNPGDDVTREDNYKQRIPLLQKSFHEDSGAKRKVEAKVVGSDFKRQFAHNQINAFSP